MSPTDQVKQAEDLVRAARAASVGTDVEGALTFALDAVENALDVLYIAERRAK